MTMAMIADDVKIDGERVADALQEIANWLDRASGDVGLDFSSVQRINPPALRALEELASIADEKALTLELRGVNVDVYKVLKLTKLAPRFRFGNRDASSSTPEQESCHAEPSARRASVLG
jgi:anti-anti-sigma regulatory factor